MKYELVLSGKFKKGLKAAKKRGLDISLLDSIVDKLLQGISLEEKYQDHPLKGNWDGFRECHIQPDVLLEYKKNKDELILLLVSIGSHSELFRK